MSKNVFPFKNAILRFTMLLAELQILFKFNEIERTFKTVYLKRVSFSRIDLSEQYSSQ